MKIHFTNLGIIAVIFNLILVSCGKPLPPGPKYPTRCNTITITNNYGAVITLVPGTSTDGLTVTLQPPINLVDKTIVTMLQDQFYHYTFKVGTTILGSLILKNSNTTVLNLCDITIKQGGINRYQINGHSKTPFVLLSADRPYPQEWNLSEPTIKQFNATLNTADTKLLDFQGDSFTHLYFYNGEKSEPILSQPIGKIIIKNNRPDLISVGTFRILNN